MSKKILITGASGFIGSALTQKIQESGYDVLKTTRNPQASSPDFIYWNPDRDEISLEALEGLEGVIHLAGENIAALRWTKAKKDRIFLSRVRGTWLLSHALLRVQRPPRFFFSASAVGYYGSRGDERLSEDSRQGSGFLAEVCGKWEEASDCLKQKGVRVVHGRFGNVLDPSGGMLKKMLPFFRLGLGMQMGTGKQWMSWIARDDLIRAIEWILFTHPQDGAVNCTSPNPVQQKEWAQLLAKAVHRPLLLKMPRSIVRLIFGEMGDELFLSSTRAEPDKLIRSGFQFECPVLTSMLQIP
ncbi:MAG: TIGR01777 family oxidoreductase [Rhabdochlamydiaceae bacterium]|nr:TIGR01777 family oxidoreductase [Rhabdochlamydiaceae bacterium]